ncbi:MAG: sigma-54-dependent transcriptional response regulator [Chlamydiales bacterium]|jgi:DNA-binding NtrC family response regulator|nr:sigma-54-dependent transcriptional response regulator [Chlamydiales bacterium]
MKRILLVDDDVHIRFSLKALLETKGFSCLEASDRASLLQLLEHKKEPVHLVLLDVQLPDSQGIDLIADIHRFHPQALIMLMTGFGSIPQSVEAMQKGAIDYILKPFNFDELFLRINNAFEKELLKEEVAHLSEHISARLDRQYVLGPNLEMQKIFNSLHIIADSDVSTVCIQGETGTGKEMIARRIHDLSQRRYKPFVDINASALSEDLLESELFGFEAGSFTGALKTKKGLFEIASEGTLFLDEVGDMGLAMQAKILRALQEKKIRRVGGTESIDIDIRLITATHKDLAKQVQQGLFREDLFYRLHVVPIYLPPLRERKEDLETLVTYFLALFNKELNRSIEKVDPKALEQMKEYDWPGNIRELKNFLERTLLLECQGTVLLPEHIKLKASERGFSTPKSPLIGQNVPLETVEREHIEKVLQAADGNKNQAAAILGIDRTTLYNKLKKYQQG